MGYIVIFNYLVLISNVALLLVPIVRTYDKKITTSYFKIMDGNFLIYLTP